MRRAVSSAFLLFSVVCACGLDASAARTCDSNKRALLRANAVRVMQFRARRLAPRAVSADADRGGDSPALLEADALIALFRREVSLMKQQGGEKGMDGGMNDGLPRSKMATFALAVHHVSLAPIDLREVNVCVSPNTSFTAAPSPLRSSKSTLWDFRLCLGRSLRLRTAFLPRRKAVLHVAAATRDRGNGG